MNDSEPLSARLLFSRVPLSVLALTTTCQLKLKRKIVFEPISLPPCFVRHQKISPYQARPRKKWLMLAQRSSLDRVFLLPILHWMSPGSNNQVFLQIQLRLLYYDSNITNNRALADLKQYRPFGQSKSWQLSLGMDSETLLPKCLWPRNSPYINSHIKPTQQARWDTLKDDISRPQATPTIETAWLHRDRNWR